MLIVKNLSIANAKKALVRNLSFSVKRGQTLCLLGESGSGKSVTSLALMGLLPKSLRCTAEQMTLLGRDLLLPRRRLHKLALIPQDPFSSLNPSYRIGPQIEEALRLHQPSVEHKRAYVEDLLEKLEIKEPTRIYDAFPHELSGGLLQRSLIAMGLAMNPSLLIADEASTALDAIAQKKLMDLLMRLQEEKNLALILVTHDMLLARRYSERILVIQKGEMIEEGHTKTVMSAPQRAYTKILFAREQRDKEKVRIIPRDTMLKVHRLKKCYGTKCALTNVSFELKRGQSLGVVGESGSGKSSLARILMGLESYHNGSVYWEPGFKRQMIFQNTLSCLNPMHQVEKLISAPMHKELSAKERRERVLEIMHETALPEHLLKNYPHQLSGGQRQRVGIARALITNPDVVICDEAVTGLDPIIKRQIIKLLQALKLKRNLTYIFISHELSLVERFCDQVILLKNGEVIERGTEVLRKPKQLYTKQLMQASLLSSETY